MPTPVNSVLVLIASPGDAGEERARLQRDLNDWNVTTGRRQAVALLPWLYERHAVAKMGDRPQSLINAQAVDRADVVLAFFDSRLGTHTGVDVSGTAEEINRAIDLGKPVHVYFSEEPLDRNVDPAQLTALAEFKKSLETRGLLGSYNDPGDLAAQCVRALESDISEEGWGERLVSTTTTGAQLTWEHIHNKEQTGVDKKGKVKTRTTRNHLVVSNSSSTTAAEDLTYTLEPANGEFHAHFDGPDEPVTVHPNSELEWLLICMQQMTLVVKATWTEQGIPREMTRTITAR